MESRPACPTRIQRMPRSASAASSRSKNFSNRCGFESAQLVVHRAQDWPTPSLSQPGSCGGGGRLIESNRSPRAFFSTPNWARMQVRTPFRALWMSFIVEASRRDRDAAVVRDPDDRLAVRRDDGRADPRQWLLPDRRRVLLLRSSGGRLGRSRRTAGSAVRRHGLRDLPRRGAPVGGHRGFDSGTGRGNGGAVDRRDLRRRRIRINGRGRWRPADGGTGSGSQTKVFAQLAGLSKRHVPAATAPARVQEQRQAERRRAGPIPATGRRMPSPATRRIRPRPVPAGSPATGEPLIFNELGNSTRVSLLPQVGLPD